MCSQCSAIGIGFNGAETNCGIAHILGILLMNSCNTDIIFSNYYHLQSVFELTGVLVTYQTVWKVMQLPNLAEATLQVLK